MPSMASASTAELREAFDNFEKAAELDPKDEKARTYIRNTRQMLQGGGGL